MDTSVITKSFGPWHYRIFIAIFYMNFSGVWQNYSIVFLAANVKYRCIEPDFGGTNDTCHVTNGSTVLPCTKWEYEGPKTIISEWDLVCDREWLVSLTKSVYMIGFLFSVFIFGQLSDIFGRLPLMFIGYVIATASMLLTLSSSSYTMFLVLRFFTAFGRMGMQTIAFVLMLEIAGVKNRTTVGLGLQFSWTLGACALSGIAWIFKDWFWLQLFMSLCFFAFSLAYVFRIIPESPRWLLIKGKHEQLKKTLNKVAARNNLTLETELTEALKEASEVEKEKENIKHETILDIFKTPQLRKRILILFYLWAVVAFMYYALLFNTNALAGDVYLNFFISSALEVVSLAVGFWGIRTVGRRLSLAAFTLGSAATCVARIALPQDIIWLQICFWMLGKFLVKVSQLIMYLYSGELFPTVVRNVAVGSCSTIARIGAILAPFVKELGKATHDWVPTVLYGSLCLVGGFLALLLPETKDREMADTLQQEEDM